MSVFFDAPKLNPGLNTEYVFMNRLVAFNETLPWVNWHVSGGFILSERQR